MREHAGGGDVEGASRVATAELLPGKRSLVEGLQLQSSGDVEGASRVATAELLPGKRSLVEGLQLQSSGRGIPPSHGVHDTATAGVGGPGERLPHFETIQHHFGRHDMSGVKAHSDGAAKEASASLGAEAYAVGNDVAFGGPPSLHTAAHEAAHVVQQRAGVHLKDGVGATGDPYEQHADRVADAVVAGESAEGILDEMVGGGDGGGVAVQKKGTGPTGGAKTLSTSSGTEGDALFGVTANEWLELHAGELVAALSARLEAAQFKLPLAEAAWRGAGAKELVTQLVHALGAGGQTVWSQLSRFLSPDTPRFAIDSGRDCFPETKGPREWNPAVAIEIGRLLAERVIESIARMLPRVVRLQNQQALRDEAGKPKLAPRPDAGTQRFSLLPVQSRATLLPPSHPIDGLVALGLIHGVDVDLHAYREHHPDEAKVKDLPDQLRPVHFEFEDKAGPNWLRVTDPIDATVEEVAFELYGDSTRATDLTVAGTLFGFKRQDRVGQQAPDRPEQRIEEMRAHFVPPVEERYQKHINRHGTIIGGIGEGAVDPVGQLLSPFNHTGEEAAKLSAGKILPTKGASGRDILQRMALIVGRIEDTKRPSVDLMVERWEQNVTIIDKAGIRQEAHPKVLDIELEIELARSRVLKRLQRLGERNDEIEMLGWDEQSKGQLELVSAGYNGVTVAAAMAKKWDGWPSAVAASREVGEAYVSAIAASDLYEEGKRRMALADEKSVLFPATVMEQLLAQLRRAVDAARVSKITQEKNQNFDIEGLEKRDQRIRAKLADVRSILLQDPKAAKEILTTIEAELARYEAGVTLVTNIDAADRAWRQLYESLSFAGGVRAVIGHHGNDIRRDGMAAARQMHVEWEGIYALWVVNPKAGEEKLREKAKSKEWRTFFDKIREIIVDQAQSDRLVTFAAMVGISLISGGIGAIAGAFAGAAWGATAGIIVEVTTGAAAFTAMSYGFVDQNPSVGGFFKQLAANMVVFGALKSTSVAYRSILGAKAATDLGKLGELTTMFATANGINLALANKQKADATGQTLTAQEITNISLETLAFVAATSLAGMLIKPWMTRMALKSELRGLQHRADGARGQLTTTVEALRASDGKDVNARAVLADQESALLHAERDLVAGLEKVVKEVDSKPEAQRAKELERYGITPELADLVRSGQRSAHLAAELDAFDGTKVYEAMESVGGNDFMVGRDSFDLVLNHYRKQGALIIEGVGAKGHVELADTRTVLVSPKEGPGFRIIERTGKRGAVSDPVATTDTAISPQDKAIRDARRAIDALEASPGGGGPKPRIDGDALQILERAKAAAGSDDAKAVLDALRKMLPERARRGLDLLRKGKRGDASVLDQLRAELASKADLIFALTEKGLPETEQTVLHARLADVRTTLLRARAEQLGVFRDPYLRQTVTEAANKISEKLASTATQADLERAIAATPNEVRGALGEALYRGQLREKHAGPGQRVLGNIEIVERLKDAQGRHLEKTIDEWKNAEGGGGKTAAIRADGTNRLWKSLGDLDALLVEVTSEGKMRPRIHGEVKTGDESASKVQRDQLKPVRNALEQIRDGNPDIQLFERTGKTTLGAQITEQFDLSKLGELEQKTVGVPGKRGFESLDFGLGEKKTMQTDDANAAITELARVLLSERVVELRNRGGTP